MHTCQHPHSCHNPINCFLPPYVLNRLAESEDAEIRQLAVKAIESAAEIRAIRSTLSRMPAMAAIPSPAGTKHRLIYDMENKRPTPFSLPGKLVRSEGDPESTDKAVNEAYDYSGIVYDFYYEIFGRNSLDNRGMELISSVHVGRNYNNAFWNGEQMAYGDGDGRLFLRFTKAIDVVAHELTHGVITNTSNLIYEFQPGALNEHFADVMGALVKQRYLGQTADEADWLNGDAIVGPVFTGKSLRTFKAEKAYENDPFLGDDRQPKYMKDFEDLPIDEDNGGVHINSGIPNHAFYITALEIGGNAWEKAGRIWYRTLLNLNRFSDFQETAEMTYQVAGVIYGNGSLEQKAVQKGWQTVGINVL